MKTNVCVFCKCGKIIFVVTNKSLRTDKEAQRNIAKFFDNGYSVAKVSNGEVKMLFGCECKKQSCTL